MAGALIVSVEIAPPDLAWLDQLRRAHYPPERNRLPAHLTMFHALPPSAEVELRARLSRLASRARPKTSVEGVLNLGSGVAFRIVSKDLQEIRRELAEDFHGMLSAQDAAGWRPHVTIQNKVPAREARRLAQQLEADFSPRSLAVSGLGLNRYLDGPWERLAIYSFRGG